MRVVLQRVTRASVTIEGAIVGEIGHGWQVLLGIAPEDTTQDIAYLAEKVANLRCFPDSEGKMNLSVQDIGGSILLVSQFTLYGDCTKGRRPSFTAAARPEVAIPLYDEFQIALRSHGIRVETGRFGADMQVELVNDGPVTMILDSRQK